MAKKKEQKKRLTLLGKSETKVPTTPSAKILETFPNPAERPYWIQFHSADFTSLCPITGQADFAELTIEYVPDERCLETKSLKFYLASYRSEKAFNEKVTNHILDDLVAACAPRKMLIKAEFAARGGIALSVTAMLPRRRGMKRAVVLLSGGLDSATTLAIARAEGFDAYALSFRYGQRHAQELVAAAQRCEVVRRERASHRGDRSAPLRRLRFDRRNRRPEESRGREMDERNPDHLRARAEHHFSLLRARLVGSARDERHFYWCERRRLQRLPGLPPGVYPSFRNDWLTSPRRRGSKGRAIRCTLR